MRTSLIGKIAGIGIVAGTLSLTGVSAAHADSPYVCDSGEFCLYENPYLNSGNYNTYGIMEWEGSDHTYANNTWRDNVVPSHDKTDHLDNETSSIKNRTSCSVTIFQNNDYGGDHTTIAAGHYLNYLTDENIGDNRASSHSFNC